MNTVNQFLVELLNFNTRRSVEKSRSSAPTIYSIRKELMELTRRARELPIAPEVIIRKVELDVPGALHNELAELRAILESKNVKVC